jgi:hypothetical protein
VELINWLMLAPPVVSLVVFLAAMVSLGVLVYLVGHLIPKGDNNSTSQSMGVFMWRSTGSLLAFLLAVNFADVRSDYMSIHRSIESEVAQLRDLRVDLDRFGTAEAQVAAAALTEYTRSVYETEWEALNNGVTAEHSWVLFYTVEDALLDLQPVTPVQQLLHKRMLDDIDEVSDYRESRIYAGNLVMPWFRVVVMVIFVFTILFVSVYPRRPARIIFVALYSLAIGLVMYSILSMSMPYQGFTQVSNQPFQDLHQEFLTYYD